VSAISGSGDRAISRRRDAGNNFEDFAEVRLIRKADLQGDYPEGRIRLDELATRRFDPQPPHILSDCTAIVPPELAGQVNRVNSNPACNRAEV
jgi:hypothetical protein